MITHGADKIINSTDEFVVFFFSNSIQLSNYTSLGF